MPATSPIPNIRKRVAFCLEYPIGQAGGVSVLVRSLITGLAKEYEVVLISPDSGPGFEADPLRPLIRNHVAFDPAECSRQAAHTLARRIAEAKVDLAHFHFGGNFAWNNRFPGRCPVPPLARLGVPVVTTVHMTVGLLQGYCSADKPLWLKLAYFPIAWLSKMSVLRHVRREIAVSQQDYERLRRWYWPVRGRFVRVYHSRISETAAPVAEQPREPVVLAVGHIAQRKGQVVLAEAFARIAGGYPEWRLLLAGHIGEESCRKQIEELARKCPRPGQISILGQRDDAAELMRRASIYVQPSFHEGLPLALQEALYYQCACVATRIAGNTELVEHQRNGLLVPPGNVAEMSRALEQLIEDLPWRERLAANARKSISLKAMTAERMIARHQKIYHDLFG